MTIDRAVLSALERDALTEIVNVGVSRAAAALRKMVHEQVLLSVPSVEFVNRGQATALLGERERDDLIAVRQDFSGAFSGRAVLILPKDSGIELVRAVLGDDLPPGEVSAMQEEALAETGNVILNGCIGTMANMLRRPLTMSLPEVLRGPAGALFQVQDAALPDDMILFLYINFSVRARDIRGYVAMLLDFPSFSALRVLIQGFIDRVMHDDAVI